MRLSGVDPGIIRELSGIYKPFIKAFKELISNAYDADAKTVTVAVAKDFSAIDVLDDGNGMTPWEFHQNFARLGGSTAWLRGGKSPGGRDRIGYKGIGFLAVARYCGALEVETSSHAVHRAVQKVRRRNRKFIPWADVLDDLVPLDVLHGRVRARSLTAAEPDEKYGRKLRRNVDYASTSDGIELRGASVPTELIVEYEVDCAGLVLNARLDFDYLLGLERRADLRLLEDFCSITVTRPTSPPRSSSTRVRLAGLKEFVVRELSAPPTKGKARNIAFKSGRDQFLWRLARASPIQDKLPKARSGAIARIRDLHRTLGLPVVRVQWRDEEVQELARPVFEPGKGMTPLDETVIPVHIDENGLKAIGYLLARPEVIYPAELRGVAVRVRNVAIGESSYFGWETLLSGPRKAAMNQISGEIVVLEGMDAADAINPGRESFYEENVHYRTLRRHLFGSGETIGGLVGEGIKSILDRIKVRSQVGDRVAAARERRRTLSDISSAVNFFARECDGRYDLTKFFSSPVKANGLSSARDVPLRLGPTVAGFDVEPKKGLGSEFEIDFKSRVVRLDYAHDVWSTTVYLNGHYYDVVLKQGRPEHPICEFDNIEKRIYVNWAHPVKLHMDDVGFLKSAILLKLAHHAATDNADAMMDLALNMLAFRAE
jgi:hypothetical protein